MRKENIKIRKCAITIQTIKVKSTQDKNNKKNDTPLSWTEIKVRNKIKQDIIKNETIFKTNNI